MGELCSVVQVLTPEDLNMPFQEVQFFAADGVSLTGWYLFNSISLLAADQLCIAILLIKKSILEQVHPAVALRQTKPAHNCVLPPV